MLKTLPFICYIFYQQQLIVWNTRTDFHIGKAGISSIILHLFCGKFFARAGQQNDRRIIPDDKIDYDERLTASLASFVILGKEEFRQSTNGADK